MIDEIDHIQGNLAAYDFENIVRDHLRCYYGDEKTEGGKEYKEIFSRWPKEDMPRNHRETEETERQKRVFRPIDNAE